MGPTGLVVTGAHNRGGGARDDWPTATPDHPRDAWALAGNANPAQSILDVRATHGHDLSRRLRIYAFGAALGGQRVLDAATLLASQSNIPPQNLTLIDRHETYAHNDPNSVSPQNDFVDGLVPFLAQIRQDRRR